MSVEMLLSFPFKFFSTLLVDLFFSVSFWLVLRIIIVVAMYLFLLIAGESFCLSSMQ